eukprot:10476339-Ditylum_brightwellii.AAC.1
MLQKPTALWKVLEEYEANFGQMELMDLKGGMIGGVVMTCGKYVGGRVKDFIPIVGGGRNRSMCGDRREVRGMVDDSR